MSARAAWRLVSLGFSRVFRYEAGKKDWLANGLPAEGEKAGETRAGDHARRDVPTCGLSESVGEVNDRLHGLGWSVCVVVNDARVVLGFLGEKELFAEQHTPVEQIMQCAPRTYRLNAPLEKVLDYMQQYQVDSVLVTTSGGELIGLLGRQDLEQTLAREPKIE